MQVYLLPFMDKIRVGAVSYLNTKPFLYGIEQSEVKQEIALKVDYPSKLAASLQRNELDLALIPVAALSGIDEADIITDFCIGSQSQVASVCLFSHVPIEDIQHIFLDYQSRTSVTLLRILLRDVWKVRPMLYDAPEDFIEQISGKTAGVIIGDRALEHYHRFPYRYDLAEVWHEYTRMPFVFAVWVSNKVLPSAFVAKLNKAFEYGVHHIDDILAQMHYPHYDLATYFKQNIDYRLNEDARSGMKMFTRLMATL